MKTAAIIAIYFLFPFILSGKENLPTDNDSVDKKAAQTKFFKDLTKIMNSEPVSEPLPAKGLDKDTLVLKSMKNYAIFAFEHRISAYKWQLLSSKIVFYIVIFIVLVGLYLSYLQFKNSQAHLIARQQLRTSQPDDPDVNTSGTDSGSINTKVKIGPGSLEIDSAVIGLVILVISLAFFYLYLNYIFPINE